MYLITIGKWIRSESNMENLNSDVCQSMIWCIIFP